MKEEKYYCAIEKIKKLNHEKELLILTSYYKNEYNFKNKIRQIIRLTTST